VEVVEDVVEDIIEDVVVVTELARQPARCAEQNDWFALGAVRQASS
jgi:hypothetical protein